MTGAPVLEAIRKLIDVQGHATTAQIVRYTKLAYDQVVDTLQRNRTLYTLKGTRIIGLGPLWQRLADERQRAFEAGGYYRVDEIDYGVQAIFFHDDELFERLAEHYTEGGYGDSITHRRVLATEKNLMEVRQAGLRPVAEFSDSPLRFWRDVDTAGRKC